MVRDFIGVARQTMKDGGFSKNTNGEESGGTFLVGFRGRLFHIADDFQDIGVNNVSESPINMHEPLDLTTQVLIASNVCYM